MSDLWSAIAKWSSVWRLFSVALFLVVCYELSMNPKVSKRTVFHQVPAKQALKSTIDLDFCYLLNIKNDNLSLDHLEDLEEEKQTPDNETDKQQFSIADLCDLSRPISLYGKLLQNWTVKQITEKFKKCKLENLIKLQNRTTIKQISPNVGYELYCDHICVRNRLEIDTSVKKTDIEITPIGNNQTFQILLSFVRLFKEDGEFRAIRKPIYKRTCRRTEQRYLCTESEKKFYLELFYSTIESLESPFETNCVYRSNNRTQRDCYEDCVKLKKKHVWLSYTEQDDYKLNFDKLTVMRPLIDSCTALCDQRPDCRSGSIAFTEIVENANPKSFILLRISEEDRMYKASPHYSKLKTSWLLIAFFCLIFKINLYNQLCKFKSIYDYVDSKNQRIKSEKKLCYVVVIAIVGFALAVGFERIAFDFGRNAGFVTYKLESIRERSLSVSICFHPCDIAKGDSLMANCSGPSLGEIDRATWDETDFKKFVTLRNSVRIVYLREMKVHVFFRDLLKCFMVYYPAPNHYPQIALQRKSEIHFNVSKHFTFFLEDGFHYPKIDSRRIQRSYLHYAHIQDLRGINCTDYSREKTRYCSSQDDCQQECILHRYVSRRAALPAFVNIKIDHFANYSNLRMEKAEDKDEKLYLEVKSECHHHHYELDCELVETKYRSKYNVPVRHNLSINLTPTTFLRSPLQDENKLVVLNRVISLMLILTGFSVGALLKRLLAVFFSMRLSFISYQYMKRLIETLLFLAFLLHFRFLVDCIMYNETDKFTFRYYSEFVKVPLLRLCYELDIDLSTNNYTVGLLNNLTLKNDGLFEKVLILDTEYHFDERHFNEKPSPVALETFYLDNALGAIKCFNLIIDERVGLSNRNFFGLDESIKVFVNLKKLPNNKRFLLYINDKGLIDLDWYKFWFPNRYYLFYYTDQKFTYQDDFWNFKNFFTLVRHWLRIEAPRNTQLSYSKYLTGVFNRQQAATTTSVPLYPTDDEKLPIKNEQFQSFMLFRSLEGNKNEFDFTINSQRYNFLSDYYNDQSYNLGNRTILSFLPSAIYSASLTTNRYHVIELFLHLTVLFAFWFKTSLAYLPKSIRKALPFFRLFIVCLLYLIVVVLILIFKVIFCVVHFMNFRRI